MLLARKAIDTTLKSKASSYADGNREKQKAFASEASTWVYQQFKENNPDVPSTILHKFDAKLCDNFRIFQAERKDNAAKKKIKPSITGVKRKLKKPERDSVQKPETFETNVPQPIGTIQLSPSTENLLLTSVPSVLTDEEKKSSNNKLSEHRRKEINTKRNQIKSQLEAKAKTFADGDENKQRAFIRICVAFIGEKFRTSNAGEDKNALTRIARGISSSFRRLEGERKDNKANKQIREQQGRSRKRIRTQASSSSFPNRGLSMRLPKH